MIHAPSVEQVVWCQFGRQWIRAVVVDVSPIWQTATVRALFPGDAVVPYWTARIDDLLDEEPSFDMLDCDYDDGEFVA